MALAAAINMPYGKVAVLEDHEFTTGFFGDQQPADRPKVPRNANSRGTPESSLRPPIFRGLRSEPEVGARDSARRFPISVLACRRPVR